MDQLKKLRDRIDWLDSQIASLLNERMRASDQMGEIKRANHTDIADPSREKSVLHQVETMVQHPVLKADIVNIYKEIMSESKIAQQFLQHLSQPFRRIGIIGLGLMGGSIIKALKAKDPSVHIGCTDYASKDAELAEMSGLIDHKSKTLPDLVRDSELIILAVPISAVIPLAKEIRACANEKTNRHRYCKRKNRYRKCFRRTVRRKYPISRDAPMAGK